MSNLNKTALLLGATGLVGTELLHILLKAPQYAKVIILTRKRMKMESPKLEQIIVDFDQLSNYKEYFHVNDVYCCLGTTIKKAGAKDAFRKVDYEYPVTAARLAKECQVEKFLIITAMGANPNTKIFYNRVKGEVEETIKSIGIPSLHFFRPSLLLGDRKEFRFGEKLASVLSPIYSFLLVGTLRQYKPIQARDVALAMYKTSMESATGTHTYLSNQIKSIIKNV